MDLKERALGAWAAEQEKRGKDVAERHEKWIEGSTKHFAKVFLALPDYVVVTAPFEVRIRSGNIKLKSLIGHSDYSLWGACQQCGKFCWSKRFIDLKGLGEMLTCFSPGPHTCKSAESDKPTAADNLREALLDFLELEG